MSVGEPSIRDERNQRTWPVLLAVWATLLLFGAVAAPVPGVNEPHYLCKAKHFWQPDWCAADFFLASPNAHTVFYVTVGSLTNVASFEQSAWIGRGLASLVLAWGWIHYLSRVLITRWAPLWSAWIFLAFEACGNFSGEWLAGGVEGKVFCYGLLFAAFGDVLRERWLRGATWCGLAISFHPVVGIWGLLAFVASRVIPCGLKPLRHPLSLVTPATVARTLLVFVLALPGLIPVVQLLRDPASAEVRYAATYLQVFFRLAHHLDPMMFPRRAYAGYAVLLAIWLSSLAWGGRTNSKRALDGIVVWAVVFAVAGILTGWGSRPPKQMPWFAERMQLLKFYPFRLADLLLPVAVSVSLISVLERTWLSSQSSKLRRFPIRQPAVVMLLIFVAGLWRVHTTSETNRYSREDRADWLDVCAWIDRHLPADALVQSPTNGWAFKWFARRAEYVAFKDCPQDAAGIVEWNRRLNELQQWYVSKYADEFYSADELNELRKQTGLTHLLTDRLGPMELEPIYRNGTFQVYDLQSPETRTDRKH